MNILKKLIRGNKLFRDYQFDEYKEELALLIEHGQKPEVLLISCCDSRVTPDFMLESKPGELFVLRNIGNFVPPCSVDKEFHGSSAAIEYAVSVLDVSHIIICGHSNCGACASLYEDIPNSIYFQNINKWLELGKEAKELTLKENPFYKNKNELYESTEKNSLKFQLKNLTTYPAIQDKLKNNTMQIHAWYYNLSDGSIEYYDKNKDNFKDICFYHKF